MGQHNRNQKELTENEMSAVQGNHTEKNIED
jgi:bacteriocin-like protein